jgi:hypothetical protein
MRQANALISSIAAKSTQDWAGPSAMTLSWSTPIAILLPTLI